MRIYLYSIYIYNMLVLSSPAHYRNKLSRKKLCSIEPPYHPPCTPSNIQRLHVKKIALGIKKWKNQKNKIKYPSGISRYIERASCSLNVCEKVSFLLRGFLPPFSHPSNRSSLFTQMFTPLRFSRPTGIRPYTYVHTCKKTRIRTHTHTNLPGTCDRGVSWNRAWDFSHNKTYYHGTTAFFRETLAEHSRRFAFETRVL